MKKERLIRIGLSLAQFALLAQALTWAFSKQSRRAIGKRDGWQCQCEDCVLGKDCSPARFQDGYMVQAAHDDHDRHNPEYDSPDNGLILCVAHHALEHLAKGEIREAQAILNMGIYTYDHRDKGIDEPQIKLLVAELDDYIESMESVMVV